MSQAFWGALTGIMIGPMPLILWFVITERREQRRHNAAMETRP